MWTVLKEVHSKQLPITRFNAYDAMLNIRKEEDESLSDLMARVEKAAELNKNLRPEGFTIDQLNDEMTSITLIHALIPENSNFVDGLMSLSSFAYSEVKEKVVLLENYQRNRPGEVPVSANAAKASSMPQMCEFCQNPKHFHKQEDCYAYKYAQKEYRSKKDKKQGNKNNDQKANSSGEKAEFAGTASAFLLDSTSSSGSLLAFFPSWTCIPFVHSCMHSSLPVYGSAWGSD
jgi:hypothetical protein